MQNNLTTNTFTAFLVILLLIASLGFGADNSNIDFDPFGAQQSGASVSSKIIVDSGPTIPQVAFNNNDISMAFQIISDATGWSIFPTAQASKAKVSLWAKSVTAKELLNKVVTLAGLVYHQDNNIISVMTYDEYRQYHGLTKHIISLEYADAGAVAGVIKPFLSKLGKSIVHKDTNMIIFYEAEANLEYITEIIEKLDTPSENIIAKVINLKYADCENLAKVLREVFSKQAKGSKNKGRDSRNAAKGNGKKEAQKSGESLVVPFRNTDIYAVTHANQLIVVGTDLNVQKVTDLVAAIDISGDHFVLEVIGLKYADADMLAETLEKVVSNKESGGNAKKAQQIKEHSGHSKESSAESKVEIEGVLLTPQAYVGVYSIGRTNQLIIKAFRSDIDKLKKLIQQLDTFLEPITKSYGFIYVEASQVYSELERILDIYSRYDSSYGLRGRSQGSGGARGSGIALVEKTNSILVTGPPSVHRIMASIVESVDQAGTYETGMIRVYKIENADVDEIAKTIQELIQTDGKQLEESSQLKFTKESASKGVKKPGEQAKAETEEYIPQIKAKVSVNKSTNSIVVQATARQHRELEKLIHELDKRRKQVLIEAMIVEITTTDNLDLGVELSRVAGDVIAFSSFGLSTNLDPTSGVRDIVVSPGGTAAVLRPDKIQAIIHALKSDANARIISAPQILVNDNAIGFINSIVEEPTTQINQGETTTTTSFAGFVEAGTQFAITPHISESKYLRVEYQITLNSFGAKPTDPSIPPPRNTSSIQSEATVPEGYTIVVGGLQTTHESENVDKVPILGDIPILDWIFKNTKIEKQYKTTYLFITPHIIESEDFADLKEVSKKALEDIKPVGYDQNVPDSKTKATK